MWQAAADAGVVHVCGFNYRFVPAVRRARELIEAGELGEIVHFRARYLQSWGWDADRASWRFDRAAGRRRARSATSATHVDRPGRFLVGEIDDALGGRAHVRPRPRGRRRVRGHDRASRRRDRHARGDAPRARPRQPAHVRDQRLEGLARLRPGALRTSSTSRTAARSGIERRRPATGGRPGHIVGWGDTFTLEYAPPARAIAGERRRRPVRRDIRGRLPRREVCDAILRSGRERAERRGSSTDEDESRDLGLRADVDALRAGRLPAAVDRRVDGGEGAPRGRGPRRPDRRVRVPLPGRALARQPRRRARGARRPRHLLPRERPAPRPAVRQGRAQLAGRRGSRRGDPAHARRRSTSRASSARTSSSGRGSRATTTRSRRRTRSRGRASSTGSARRRSARRSAASRSSSSTRTPSRR